MRFFEGIPALDCSQKESAALLKEGSTIRTIRRVEFIPGRLLLSRARFRLIQHCNIADLKLYLQPVEKSSHLLHHGYRSRFGGDYY